MMINGINSYYKDIFCLIGQSMNLSLVLKLKENPKVKIKIRERKNKTKGKESNIPRF